VDRIWRRLWRRLRPSASSKSTLRVAAALLAVDPMFDLAMALRRLPAEGLVAGFSLADSDPTTPN
jgi:hypothetical protein